MVENKPQTFDEIERANTKTQAVIDRRVALRNFREKASETILDFANDYDFKMNKAQTKQDMQTSIDAIIELRKAAVD